MKCDYCGAELPPNAIGARYGERLFRYCVNYGAGDPITPCGRKASADLKALILSTDAGLKQPKVSDS